MPNFDKRCGDTRPHDPHIHEVDGVSYRCDGRALAQEG